MIHKNDLLVKITGELAEAKPDWAYLREWNSQKLLEISEELDSNVVSSVSERHVQQSLEKICSELKDRALINPIRPGQIGGYTFKRPKNKNVYVQKGRHVYSEMDALIVVDSLPVLFEVKLSTSETKSATASMGWKNGFVKKHTAANGKVRKPGSLGVNYAMTEQRIDYLLHPIREYFGQEECGYVLVILPEMIKPGSDTLKNFINSNGIVVPFYTSRSAFIEDIKSELSPPKMTNGPRFLGVYESNRS